MELIKEIKRISKTEYFKKTPYFYIYDLSTLKKKLNLLFDNKLSNSKIYYSLKANPNKELLKNIIDHESIAGIEVASIGELKLALKLTKPEHIIFTGPAKNNYELKFAIKNDINLIIVESFIELYRIENIAKKLNKTINILIRINTTDKITSVSTNMCGDSTKFGFQEETLFKDIIKILEFKSIKLKGLHFYSASGILDYKLLLKHSVNAINIFNKLNNEYDLNLEVLDIGGGFGIDYSDANKPFDIISYFSDLRSHVLNNNLSNKTIIFEIGRYILGEAGYYCCEILDIKECRGKNFILVSGGVNHLNRPNVTGENQPIMIISKENNIQSKKIIQNKIVDICGPLCFAEDKIGKDIHIKYAKIGDLLIVKNAGTYGLIGSPMHFILHPLPKEFLWEGQE